MTDTPVDALPREPRYGEWRDIATAPRDGTPILAYDPDVGEGEQCIAVVSWYVHRWREYEPTENGLFREVSKELGGSWEGGPWSPWRATHWMPLPPTPFPATG